MAHYTSTILHPTTFFSQGINSIEQSEPFLLAIQVIISPAPLRPCSTVFAPYSKAHDRKEPSLNTHELILWKNCCFLHHFFFQPKLTRIWSFRFPSINADYLFIVLVSNKLAFMLCTLTQREKGKSVIWMTFLLHSLSTNGAEAHIFNQVSVGFVTSSNIQNYSTPCRYHWQNSIMTNYRHHMREFAGGEHAFCTIS